MSGLDGMFVGLGTLCNDHLSNDLEGVMLVLALVVMFGVDMVVVLQCLCICPEMSEGNGEGLLSDGVMLVTYVSLGAGLMKELFFVSGVFVWCWWYDFLSFFMCVWVCVCVCAVWERTFSLSSSFFFSAPQCLCHW